MTYVLIGAGIALLLFGGEAVVRGSVALADRLGISPLIVGLTVVGFGTSLPELVVSVNAALSGAPGIAVGNVIGSNVANTMLILGVAAVLLPIAVTPEAVRRDAVCMLAATVAFVALGLTGGLVWWQGLVLVCVLCGYILVTVRRDARAQDAAARRRREETEELGVAKMGAGAAFLIVVAGICGVVLGAEWLVDGATGTARRFGVPDEVIGLTMVAVGTSLPELATATVAALRGHSDVCVGNVLGSNLFNLFGIAGVTALFAPLPFSDQIVGFDLWVLLGATLLAMPFMATGLRVSRLEGGLLLGLYGAYVAAQFTGWGAGIARAVAA